MLNLLFQGKKKSGFVQKTSIDLPLSIDSQKKPNILPGPVS